MAYLAISGMLGVGVGALVTNQVTAVVAVFVVLFVVDPVVRGAGASLREVQPPGDWDEAQRQLERQPRVRPVSRSGSPPCVYLGYAVAMLAATAAIVTRRDVT